jgi:hypothetical protein
MEILFLIICLWSLHVVHYGTYTELLTDPVFQEKLHKFFSLSKEENKLSVDILFQDDVTVILLLSVSLVFGEIRK